MRREELNRHLHELHQAVIANNDRILRVLPAARRNAIHAALDALETSLYDDKFNIVREVPAKATWDRYRRFWLVSRRHNSPYSDDWFGECYIKIKNGRWIEIRWRA